MSVFNIDPSEAVFVYQDDNEIKIEQGSEEIILSIDDAALLGKMLLDLEIKPVKKR